MYNKKYAEAWIADSLSGRDEMRVSFIFPYLKEIISQSSDDSKILDVGCGWGIAVPYLKLGQKYYGIDVTTDFFDYVKKKYPERDLVLQYGALPGPFDFEDGFFDLIICSMSLHTVEDLSSSIDNLFSKLKPSGKLVIIDFNDVSQKEIVGRFRDAEIKENYCKGIYMLDCGKEIESEIFFHQEKDYEEELKKYGNFVKKDLCPVFVSYELVKK